MKNKVTRSIDFLAGFVLIASVGLIVTLFLALLTITMGWLVLPVLAIFASLAWASYRKWW